MRVSARRYFLFLNCFGVRQSSKYSPLSPIRALRPRREKKMENCNNEMLNRAMRNAGIRNGFEDITAEFFAFRDFKLKWTRSYKWISF